MIVFVLNVKSGKVVSRGKQTERRRTRETTFVFFIVEELSTDGEDGCLLFQRGRDSWALCCTMRVLQGTVASVLCRSFIDKAVRLCSTVLLRKFFTDTPFHF